VLKLFEGNKGEIIIINAADWRRCFFCNLNLKFLAILLFQALVAILEDPAAGVLACYVAGFLASIASFNSCGVYISPCIQGCLLISSRVMR